MDDLEIFNPELIKNLQYMLDSDIDVRLLNLTFDIDSIDNERKLTSKLKPDIQEDIEVINENM